MTGKKLADTTSIADEKLDLYDKREYPGVDKALLWATRGLMRRADIKRVGILTGYRCWHDNYHYTDDTRWRHRRLTFHLGKAIEFYHDKDASPCTEIGADPDAAPCAECGRIRDVARAKCGFQLRWHEPSRVSVAEGAKTAAPPANPFAVHVNTVRRVDREDDDFVKTYFDSVQPVFKGNPGFSFPVDLGAGVNPRIAVSETFFSNTESGAGGWFPIGASRIWHGGIHLYAPAGTAVRAIADGEVIGCRITESATAKPYGSRNFVLIRHLFKTKKYYSLYYHLNPQPEAAAADLTTTTRWRNQLYLQTKDHVEALAPCPFIMAADIGGGKKRLKPRQQLGLGPGERAQTQGGNIDPKTIEDPPPLNSTLIKLSDPADTYVFTKLEGKDLARKVAADASAKKARDGKNAGLKNPIRVQAGEIIGQVAVAATDAAVGALGTFVHVELFSAEAFLTGDGWTQVDVAAAGDVADRKALVTKLVDKKLLSAPPDKVLLPGDLTAEQDVYRELLRAGVLKMPSQWSIDWKNALTTPDCLAFIKSRTDLGKAFNDYVWWNDLKSDGADLPASPVVFHYHPIGALLAMAYA